MQERLVEVNDSWGTHRLRVLDYGDDHATRTVVCVHGLTRNGFDFDVLAKALAGVGYRVLAPDIVGRGGSSWLADPKGYTVEVYADHMRQLLDQFRLDEVDWIGTSMGGLIALELAGAGEAERRFRSLVLNDIGPFVPRSALEMIKTYLDLDLVFDDIKALEEHLRLIHAPFGPLSDEQWAYLANHSARTEGDRWRLHYDPEIRLNFSEAALSDIEIWDCWQAIACPTLIVRGADSLLFDQTTMNAMTVAKKDVQAVEIPGVGHAPALMDSYQIELIQRFLRRACRSSAE